MMQVLDLAYTVGVKRRFLPIFKTYKVVAHVVEAYADSWRLVLTGADGSVTILPGIHRKIYKIYPDLHAAERNQKRLREEKNGQKDTIGRVLPEPLRTTELPDPGPAEGSGD